MIRDGVAPFDPEVGMGATILGWTDRNPATIVGVQRFKSGQRKGEIRAVEVQEDHAVRTDQNGMSECQSYDFSPNEDAAVLVFRKRKDGRFGDSSASLRIGSRDKYYDYSF
jgi:hypothetical protein